VAPGHHRGKNLHGKKKTQKRKTGSCRQGGGGGGGVSPGGNECVGGFFRGEGLPPKEKKRLRGKPPHRLLAEKHGGGGGGFWKWAVMERPGDIVTGDSSLRGGGGLGRGPTVARYKEHLDDLLCKAYFVAKVGVLC